MFGSRRGRRDVKGGACRRMQRTPTKEVILMHTADGLFLAHYERDKTEFMKKS